MTPEPADPLIALLSELTGPPPAAARDSRVRARCHAAMASAHRPRPFTHAALRAIDRMLPVAVVVYGLVTLVAGLRTAGILP